MSRKGPWEGYRRQAKQGEARCLLPAFLCVRERDVWVAARLGTRQGHYYYGQFALSLGKESRPYIFSRFSPLNTGTFCGPSVSVSTEFDCKGDVTRDDSQRRFLAQHSVATLLRHCFEWLQHWSSIATLYCAKNRRCESSRVTST